MKKKAILALISIAIVLTGCGENSGKKISEKEAIKAIKDYSPGAVITECEYDEDSMVYEIEFGTEFGKYEGKVSAKNGDIISVITEEPISAPQTDGPSANESNDNENTVTSKQAFSHDDALAIAIIDADVGGSVLTVKNSYDKEDNCYDIVFRSGNKEFSYKIDAETGDIKESSVDMDS